MKLLHRLMAWSAAVAGTLGQGQPAAPESTPGSGTPAGSEFVLFDHFFKHTGSRQLYQNWNFDTRKEFAPGVPLDWLAGRQPILDVGIYLCRVEVTKMERPWSTPPHVQFGWWNLSKEADPSIRHIAAPPIILGELQPPAPGRPWVYEYIGTVRSLDVTHMFYGAGPRAALPGKVTDWDWRHAYAAGTAYTLFNPRGNQFDANGDGKLDDVEYPDIEFKLVLKLFLPGSPRYREIAGRLSAGQPSRGKPTAAR